MNNMLLGRFIQGHSFPYRLDPRSKLLTTIFFVFIIFFANNWESYALMIAYTGILMHSTKVQLRVFYNGLKPLIFLILFTSALQLFFVRIGTEYFHFGPFYITSGGIINAIFIFIRFTLIILMSTILTVTTSSVEIASGLTWLLNPLRYVNVPVDDIALMMSISLRFVPTLFEKFLSIMKAQRARGAILNEGGLIKRAKSLLPLIIPLFVKSVDAALTLSTAMESRGYRDVKTRSHYRIMKWGITDLMHVIVFVIVVILMMLLRTE
ncbi:MAG: energy-coupling factor transporter transmembrane component T [Lactobacillus sp.]|nr:energy-coupling factor transporter transmembrane component T [Lactobacillus sp.]